MSTLLASDAQNREFMGAHNPDDTLFVTFYRKPIEMAFLSEQEGHPVFQEVDFVRIMTPGNQLNQIDTFVRPEHKVRFPRQWAAYQNAQGESREAQEAAQQGGMPVGEWPAITRTRAEELRAMKFFTVEQIANCSDQQLATLGMDANQLRLKARAYLERAHDSAKAQADAAEVDKLKQTIADMQLQMAAMMQDQPPKRGPGRPPKEAHEDRQAS